MLHQQRMTPSGTVQQKNSGCNQQKNISFLKMKIKDLESQLSIMDELFSAEKERRKAAEKESKSFKTEINRLEQDLDFYQSTTETQEKSIQTLKEQLEEKDVLFADLQKRFSQESENRLLLEQERRQNEESANKLKTEIDQLKQGRDHYQLTAETCQKAIKDLQIQLQEKDTLCETLLNQLQEQQNQATVHKEKLAGVTHQLERKSLLCEDLTSKFDKEQQLRHDCEAELDKTRVLITENSDLKQEIQDLTDRNSELRDLMEKSNSEKVSSEMTFIRDLQKLEEQLGKETEIRQSLESELVQSKETARLNEELVSKLRTMQETETNLQSIIVNLQLDQIQAKEKHETDLEILNQQLHRLSCEFQPCPETSVGTDLMLGLEQDSENPDYSCQTETEVCSPTEICAETPEAIRCLHTDDTSLDDDLSYLEDAPQTVTRLEKISMWRRFKKFMTPTCLRKHKNKS
nr:uncharacterized protein LOC107394060 [Nothobranchius furzeri]